MKLINIIMEVIAFLWMVESYMKLLLTATSLLKL